MGTIIVYPSKNVWPFAATNWEWSWALAESRTLFSYWLSLGQNNAEGIETISQSKSPGPHNIPKYCLSQYCRLGQCVHFGECPCLSPLRRVTLCLWEVLNFCSHSCFLGLMGKLHLTLG